MSQEPSVDVHYKSLLSSNYIRATDLDGHTATIPIKKVVRREMEEVKNGAETGRTVTKGVILFDGKSGEMGWVLNSTNSQCIAAMFGERTGGWIGKRVSLRVEMVQVGRKKEPGIRVFGSPDIEHEIECVVELPRKKPQKVILRPTGRAAPNRPTEPPADDGTGATTPTPTGA